MPAGCRDRSRQPTVAEQAGELSGLDPARSGATVPAPDRPDQQYASRRGQCIDAARPAASAAAGEAVQATVVQHERHHAGQAAAGIDGRQVGHVRYPPLTGISPKTLTDRLRDLEEQGLVERAIYAEIPPRVEYSLTQKGRTLEPVISALAAWGRSAGEPASAPGAAPVTGHRVRPQG